MATKSIKVPVGKTVSWYVSEEGYVPQKGTYIMGDNAHSLNINLQTYQEAPLTMVFSGVAGTLSNIDTTKNVQYKRNDGAWTTAGSSIDVNPGDIIQFKGEYTQFDQYTCWVLSNGSIIDKVCGNIASVIDPVNYSTMTTYPSTYTFNAFFYEMRGGLIDAGDLVLPATTLTASCYRNLFTGCTLLTKSPELPAMNLAPNCYYNMFSGCNSLTVAPELPATTLANNCYGYMFQACDGLTKAPDLLAETLVNGCYQYMFQNCSHLNYIKCMAHNYSYYSTRQWVMGVAASGTFVKYVHNTSWPVGNNGIPTGWVTQDVGDQHTITIVPTPSDATVIMNGVEQSSIYDWYGNTYTWSVSKTGYVTQSGSGVIRGDETIPVTLVLQKHTFNIVPTPGDATVIINGEERTSITADYGTTISWSVSKAGYVTQSGITTLTSDTVVPVNLVLETHTFTIVPTPSDATVIINGEERTSFTADYGTAITWSVSREHYVTQSGSTTLTADTSLPVTLALEQHTFTITPTPSDATVTINGEERSSVTVDYLSSITWSVSRTGYASQSGSYTMGDSDYTLPVNLAPNQYTFTITPTPNDAIVTINGVQRTSFTAAYGTTISWSVSKTGYVTQSNTFTLEGDSTLPVTLVLEKHTFSINATPSDAMVVINGVERSSFVADYGTAITWSVTREGYAGQTGSYTLTQDHTENVSLVINQYTFTITPVPNDAVVTINGQQRSTITADYGTEITWSISKEHYVTQSNTFTLRRNETLAVALSLEQFTVTINPTPSDATVMINGMQRNSLVADYGTTVTWNVSRIGCVPRHGSIANLEENTTINVELVEYEDYPMTFDVITNGTIRWSSKNSNSTLNIPIYYRINDGEWIEAHSDLGGTEINVVAGDQVSFKGRNTAYWSFIRNSQTTPVTYTFAQCYFGGTSLFNAYGNVLSMIYSDDFINYDTTFSGNLAHLFEGSNIVSASGLCLTATTLPSPAPTPGPAVIGCCQEMFSACTSLIDAPELPATTLTNRCYDSMFRGCASLTTAPSLPAAILANHCYYEMFRGCTSLTTAPDLLASQLEYLSYSGMFYGCSSLNYIKCLAVNLYDSTYGVLATQNWVSGVAAEGTFIYSPGTDWSVGDSGIPEGWTTIAEDDVTMDITQAGTIIWISDYSKRHDTIQYKLNDGDWIDITSNTTGVTINVDEGDVIKFKGNNNDSYGDYKGCSKFDGTAYFNLSGNIMSLIKGQSVVYNYSFYKMFSGTNVIDASRFKISASILKPRCYASMFEGCTHLTLPPFLKFTKADGYCCLGMFKGCSSMTNTPSLPATTLAYGCYSEMFSGCASLTSAPALPTMSQYLKSYCYYGMFKDCTSLTTAPKLDGNILVNIKHSCSHMFEGCTSLSYIWCHWQMGFEYLNDNVVDWVKGVGQNGTFYCCVYTQGGSWERGDSGIPLGWEVKYIYN